ncbi:unnamed protein product [Allacma fusca]|uniref:Heat shock protein 70 n=1 Tax=Allacma fusca TaxID=39272 RepID=A0A8J2P8T8_9HEXA|nr:unnamed protein product [Allacma fusca]
MGYVNILGIDGDPNLGGEDFDNELMNFCIEEFRKEHLVDLRAQPGSSNILRRLKVACEKQKRFLSEAKKAKVSVDAVHGKLPISVLITRDIFNSLIEKYIMICLKIVDRVLAKVNPPGIHEVVLVGGSSRIPLVQEMLKKRFPQKVIIRKFNPDEAVARGAAILGSLIEETSSSMTLIQEMGQMVLT